MKIYTDEEIKEIKLKMMVETDVSKFNELSDKIYNNEIFKLMDTVNINRDVVLNNIEMGLDEKQKEYFFGFLSHIYFTLQEWTRTDRIRGG